MPAMNSFEVEPSVASSVPVREFGANPCRASNVILGTLGTALAVWVGSQTFSDSATPSQSQKELSLVVDREVNSTFYDAPPTTVKGCVCRDPPVTSTRFSCNSQMYCVVESKDCPGGEAHWSWTQGYYDYCQFPTYQPYEDLTAAEKAALLLDAINSDRTFGDHPHLFTVLSGMLGQSMMFSFDAEGDVFAVPRTKYIHSVGFVGPVRFESYGGHEYTGVFKGAEHGLIRFSSGGPPGGGTTGPKFAPGFGLKFLRDGQLSANLVALTTLAGQPCSEDNFFVHNFTTKITAGPSFALGVLAAKFQQASLCSLQTGLSDFANESGVSPIFPYELVFRPADLNESFPCDIDLLRQRGFGRGSLVGGKVLFEVLAVARPGDDPSPIGRLVLSGTVTSSKFGDEQLFFKHQRKEEDWALRPEWLSVVDMEEECGVPTAGAVAPTWENGCSSPFGGMLSTDTTAV